jgi:hypothetical protein
MNENFWEMHYAARNTLLYGQSWHCQVISTPDPDFVLRIGRAQPNVLSRAKKNQQQKQHESNTRAAEKRQVHWQPAFNLKPREVQKNNYFEAASLAAAASSG